MLEKDLLTKKLELLSGYETILDSLIAHKDITSIKTDKVLLPAVERYFQLMVDLMIDINVAIIKSGNLGAPDDLQSTFKTLGEHAVLKEPFGTKIAPVVGARNMLVHRYEKLDKELFLSNLKNNFSDFKTYISAIFSYIKNQP